MELFIPVVGTIVFLSVLAAGWAARSMLAPERTARDRIAEVTRGTGTHGRGLFSEPVQTTEIQFQIAKFATPSSETEQNLLRQRLIQGGFRSPTNMERYLTVRALSALIPPVVCLMLAPSLSLPATLVLALGTATFGYYLPAFFLDWQVNKRQAAIMRPFPDALDLLVCCVEAGLGLDAAFRRVADEMKPAAPELSHELQLVNHEIAAGVPRADALKGLDRRTGLSEMNSLVSVLVQADRFGTSIAKALRIHADLVRAKRMLFAEEKAAQISPKLTVAMILFILPTLVIVLIGPAIINIGKNLWPTLSGGGM